MTAVAAIALPIILAVMGIVVSISPPRGDDRRARWIWLAAFLIIGLLAIGVGIKDRLNADAMQERLQRDIEGLKDAVKELTKPIRSEPAIPARDPDTLYQNGNPVGKVIGARITLNESRVYFEQIENAGNLDKTKNFEYRDYILRFVRADSYIGMLVTPGGVATNVYQHVVCEITGRIK